MTGSLRITCHLLYIYNGKGRKRFLLMVNLKLYYLTKRIEKKMQL